MRSVGSFYEQKVCDYLSARGYEILERNFAVRGGEIDIIARDRDTIVFVEVKSQRGGDVYSPLEKIDGRKIKKIGKAALIYLKENFPKNVPPVRFDAAAVVSKGNVEDIEYLENAFCPEGYFI